MNLCRLKLGPWHDRVTAFRAVRTSLCEAAGVDPNTPRHRFSSPSPPPEDDALLAYDAATAIQCVGRRLVAKRRLMAVRRAVWLIQVSVVIMFIA